MYDTSISIKHGMKTKFYEKPVFAGLEFGYRVDENSVKNKPAD
jgi:hypothetical protein